MDQVSEIREKIDIVSFIQEFIPLKKAGRNFRANCPFHSENTPSFVVSPERQIWHCFGCGKGGDAFTFLMEYENMEFPESLRALAKKAGVSLKESGFVKDGYSEKEKIYTINTQALKFYKYILNNHPLGKAALSYLLEKRKLKKTAIETFELGFSPNAQSALSDYLIKKKGYKNKDLLLAGVSYERGTSLNDFFKGRIIFPLFDHRGNITGFSGRGLTDTQIPKYLNTRETPVYHKGSMFFGLKDAKDEIKKKQDAVIVEGEFDAISLFENGVKNVVAIKGTALTESQVNLLARFTPKITLCLDQDNAGFDATVRSLEVIEKKGLTTSIIVLKGVKDPDEAINKNPEGFKKALKESIGIYDFLIDKITLQNDKKEAEGKRKITDTLLPLFSHISNEIVKEHYIKKLSVAIDVSLDSLYKEFEKISKKETEDKVIIPKKNKRSERQVIEEYVLALISQSNDPKDLIDENKKILLSYKFETQSLGKILLEIVDFLEGNKKFDAKLFSKSISKELISAFDTCYLFPLSKFVKDETMYPKELSKRLEKLEEFNKKDKALQSFNKN